jgi:Cu-Zn family superoxide dismutase
MKGRTGLATLFFVAGIFLLLTFSCSPEAVEEAVKNEVPAISGPDVSEAVAVMHPTEGNEVSGTVHFTKTENGIRVVADINGLTPGEHGFHIHSLGDCSAADASSAEGHFNPGNKPHGAPTDTERHAGDLGNLNADDNGNAHYDWEDDILSFSGAYSIIGRSVIIHSGQDDLQSQPTGNSGARVACGVIGIAGEQK